MHEGKATWHWSFLLYAWIVKENGDSAKRVMLKRVENDKY